MNQLERANHTSSEKVNLTHSLNRDSSGNRETKRKIVNIIKSNALRLVFSVLSWIPAKPLQIKFFLSRGCHSSYITKVVKFVGISRTSVKTHKNHKGPRKLCKKSFQKVEKS